MPKLPSSGNVPQVPVARDPGLNVPAAAFEQTSPMGGAAEMLGEGLGRLAEAQRKVENRRETVDRSAKINEYNLDLDNELNRLTVEDDLSREDVLGNFGKYMAQKRQELLAAHQGSGDSRATLEMRLQDVEARYIGAASGISTRLGREKVKQTFSDAINPLARSAAMDPSPENIARQYQALETQIDDVRGAFDPVEEESMRRAAREHITLSAIQPIIMRGDVEYADSMLANDSIANSLTKESQRSLRQKIMTVRINQEESDRKIQNIERVLGRKLTQTEILSAYGISTGGGGKPSKVTKQLGGGRAQDYMCTSSGCSPFGEQYYTVEKLAYAEVLAQQTGVPLADVHNTILRSVEWGPDKTYTEVYLKMLSNYIRTPEESDAEAQRFTRTLFPGWKGPGSKPAGGATGGGKDQDDPAGILDKLNKK